MTQYQVLSHITLSEKGPVVTKTIDHANQQPVHLQQGSLDGACGPYCLCMALILLGFEKHSKLSSLDLSSSSKKLFSYISKFSDTLIIEGTYLHVMKKYAQLYKDMGLRIDTKSADIHGNSLLAKKGKKKDYNGVRDFIIEHARKDRPVILGSTYHYALVVGLGFENEISELAMPRYLLLLDPNVPAPNSSAWNGIIDMNVKGNNWFGTGGFNFEAAMALWRE